MLYDRSTTGRIPGLDALRFLGALSVVLLHVGSQDWFDDAGWGRWHPLVSGNTGVVLFYVLSGFLITSLAVDEVRSSGCFLLGKFFVRRALRLFPLYYLALLVVFGLSLMKLTTVTGRGWAYSLGYAFNFVPRTDYNGLIGAFHTLATEEQFYLVYGLLLWLLIGRAATRTKLTVGLSALGAALLASNLGNDRLPDLFAAYQQTHFVARWMPVAADPLLIGALAAVMVKLPLALDGLGWLAQRPRWHLPLHLLLLASSLSLFLGFAGWHRSTNLLSIGFALLVVDLHLFRATRLATWGEFAPLAYLGKLSYGIYVWQSVINGTGASSRWISSAWISTTLVFVVSALSYELFEKRFLRLKPYGGKRALKMPEA